ncbi:MAG: 6-phosphofructokinase [Verrucomicrobiota bacterium]
MKTSRRIAINVGGRYVPGLNAALHGAVRAAAELDWQLVGIRDGWDGLLFPERYPEGGTLDLTPALMESLAGATGCALGTASHTNPFHVRRITGANAVEEIDRSGELLLWMQREGVDAVISIADGPALSILWKLQRKGLNTVCIAKSAENEVAATQLSFGFNSTLSFVAGMLDHARQAAAGARKIGVVEVPGEHAGWLALQAGIAVSADAVLIPEIPYDLGAVAPRIAAKLKAGRPHALVVVAEGARAAAGPSVPGAPNSLKSALSPGATGEPGGHVIAQSGRAAEAVALDLQRRIHGETFPLVLGPLARAGEITAVDRQLGIACGAAAVRALQLGQAGTMVSFQPPELKFVPLAEVINRFRTVPPDSLFIQTARALGIALGD